MVSKLITVLILVGLFSIQGCASDYYIEKPICVAYIHHGAKTSEAKWFTGKYARIYPDGFLDGLKGYIWEAKQSERLYDHKAEHLPWGYYYVDLEIGDIGYYLKGMAIGNCIFIWPNSISDAEFEKLR